jgi:hypothetical protein
MRSWALIVLAACSGKPAATTAKTSPRDLEEPTKSVCITPPDDSAEIVHASADGTQVQYCIGETDCFAVDLGTNTYHRLIEPPKQANRGARVEATTPKLDVCTGNTCTSLVSKVIPGAATMRAATTADGVYAVVLLGDAPKGAGYAEVWNVAKTKKSATFRYARGDFRCGEVAMLDSTIYLSAAQCGQPAARAGLYTLTGRRIANVGGKDFGSFGGAYVHVDGATWAFLDENATQIVLQDVVKGKVWKTIDTSAVFAGAKMGTPGESALVRLQDGRLVVIAGSPAVGTIGLVDVGTGEVTLQPPPLCKR